MLYDGMKILSAHFTTVENRTMVSSTKPWITRMDLPKIFTDLRHNDLTLIRLSQINARFHGILFNNSDQICIFGDNGVAI